MCSFILPGPITPRYCVTQERTIFPILFALIKTTPPAQEFAPLWNALVNELKDSVNFAVADFDKTHQTAALMPELNVKEDLPGLLAFLFIYSGNRLIFFEFAPLVNSCDPLLEHRLAPQAWQDHRGSQWWKRRQEAAAFNLTRNA